MTARQLGASTAEPGRFVLTLGWAGQDGGDGSEECRVGLDALDAARLRDALSLWLAGVDEAQLRRAVEAWHATVRAARTSDDEDDGELDGDAA
jgi:hypothetical protein